MDKDEALQIIIHLINNNLVAHKQDHIKAERALQVLKSKDEAED